MSENVIKNQRRPKGTGSWGTVTKKGVVYQRFRKNYDGKQKEFIGRTKREVRQKVSKFEEEMENQRASNICKDYDTTTVYEYAKEWLVKTQYGILNDTYYDTLEKTLECYIKDTDFGNSYFKNITEKEDFKNHYVILAQKYSVSVIKKTHSFLCKMYDYANQHNHTAVSPRGTKLPGEDNVASKKKAIEILNDEQMYKMVAESMRKNTAINKINGDIGTPVYKTNNALIVVLILFTGIRTGECFNIDKKRDIDLENNMLTIREQTTRVRKRDEHGEFTGEYRDYIHDPKTAKGFRTFPMNPYARFAVEQLLERTQNIDSPYLCVTPSGTRPSASNLTRTMKTMMLRANITSIDIPHFGLHDARHSYASFLLRNKVRDDIVAKWVGHDVITTKQTYSHILNIEEIKALDIFKPLDVEKIVIDDTPAVPQLEEIFKKNRAI